MISIEIRNHRGTCISFVEQFSALELQKKKLHPLKDVLLELGDRV